MLEGFPPTRSETVAIRDCHYRTHHWEPHSGSDLLDSNTNNPPLFVLHGWMDTGPSFGLLIKAVLEALPKHKRPASVIAPDWRGFGDSSWNVGAYWFPDYLADLDCLLNHYSADQPATLIGHSMGANITATYSGTRPERVKAAVVLEGFGLPDSDPNDAPKRMRQWFKQEQSLRPNKLYPDLKLLTAKLQKNNPRLSPEMAQWVAELWTNAASDGSGFTLKGDPKHRHFNPVLYRLAEAQAFWRAITAPVLWVEGAETAFKDSYSAPEIEARKALMGNVTTKIIQDAEHMLHHEQPTATAKVIADFLAAL